MHPLKQVKGQPFPVHPSRMNAANAIMAGNVQRFNCVQLPKQEHPENHVADAYARAAFCPTPLEVRESACYVFNSCLRTICFG
jgi:hypothetical protein